MFLYILNLHPKQILRIIPCVSFNFCQVLCETIRELLLPSHIIFIFYYYFENQTSKFSFMQIQNIMIQSIYRWRWGLFQPIQITKNILNMSSKNISYLIFLPTNTYSKPVSRHLKSSIILPIKDWLVSDINKSHSVVIIQFILNLSSFIILIYFLFNPVGRVFEINY